MNETVRNGKVALVTGSSSGIGRGVANALARAGYDIAVHYSSSEDKAKAVVEELKVYGVNTCLLQGDTGDPDVPARLVSETVAALGRLDLLVSNAGFTKFETLLDITVETMDALYQVDFRGMILMAQAAARYMVERFPSVVQTMLSYFRTGDYARGYAYYNGIGTAYDANFTSWLDSCATDLCLSPGIPKAAFDATVRDLNVQLTDRSTETDGKGGITGRAWNFGDGTTSTTASPTKSYRAAGTYTVTLTVTDSYGKTATTSQTVTVTAPAAPAACTDPDARKLDYNCFRTGRSADAGSSDMMYIFMPAGTTTLTVSTSGGTGTAYLYYNDATWASPSAFTASSTTPNSTTQTITVSNPQAGYRYLSLYAATDFSNVTVATQF